VEIADLVEHLGVFHQNGIGIVDAIDFGGLQDGVGLDLHGTQGSGGVGGKVRIAGAGGEDDHSSLLQVADGAPAAGWFGGLVHFDGRNQARIDGAVVQSILQGERVDDRGEHAHVVGGNAVHVARLVGHATEEIAASHYDCSLHAERVHLLDLTGDLVD